MAKLIHTHFARVRGPDGGQYEATTYGDAQSDGTWIGWLEFRPVSAVTGADGTRVLRTDRETTQPDRAAVEYWAGGLEPIHLEGAFARARALEPKRPPVGPALRSEPRSR